MILNDYMQTKSNIKQEHITTIEKDKRTFSTGILSYAN